MATINDLPPELIDIILGKDISIEDVINFKSTCKQFWSASLYKKDWEKKLSERWPSAKKLYDKKSKEKQESARNEENNEESLTFIEAATNCVKQLRNVVSELMNNCNDSYLIDNFTNFEHVFHLKSKHLNDIITKPENFMTSSLFVDEIKHMLTQPLRRTDCDLTKKYCIKNMFCYLRQHSTREKWEIFKKRPQREQLLERCATIFAQWLQPEKDIFYSNVKTSLNNITQGALKCLAEKHPNHSIFSTSSETFSYWEKNNIGNNYWNEAEATQIMDTLQEYIFGKLHFLPNKSKDSKLEYMYIDNVLENKYGQEIILSIIYHSVARRLGLRCDVVKLHTYTFHTLICIFWKPNYTIIGLENSRCFNIICAKFPDCIDDKLPLCRMLYSAHQSILTIPAKQMLLDMLQILVNMKNWYNKTLMIMPREMNMSRSIANKKVDRFLQGHYADLAPVLPFFKKVSFFIKNTEQSINTRSKEKFAVGMIVNCNQPTLKCFKGVIIGWCRYMDRNNIYFATSEIYDPILPLKIYSKFSAIKQQTHYLILTEKNEMCYAEEYSLTLTTGWIENNEIGRYFSKFEETHYVPNQNLAKKYPQDAAVAAKTTQYN